MLVIVDWILVIGIGMIAVALVSVRVLYPATWHREIFASNPFSIAFELGVVFAGFGAALRIFSCPFPL